MLRIMASRLSAAVVPRVLAAPALPQAVAVQASRAMSHGPVESDSEFDSRWEKYFQAEDLDSWELRNGLNQLYGEDLVPEPKILIAALHACRRLDDYAMTARILEIVHYKAGKSTDIVDYVMQQLKPTMDELGVSSIQQLGLE